MKSIKEKIEEAAYDHTGKIGYGESTNATSNFRKGAQYGYRLAMELLRSEKALDDFLGKAEPTHDEWASWLEKQLEGGSNE